MTVVEIPSGTHAGNRWLGGRLLGGRFRLDERISLDDQVSGPRGFSWEARGFSLWKASDQLLGRPVTIYLLPQGVSVPHRVVEAVQSAAKVTDPRLAAIYDTDFIPKTPETPKTPFPYIVSEWAPGTPLEDLVLTGLPRPALAAAMIADAADALAVAHQAGAAPAPDPALAALGPRQRSQDHRSRPRRGAVRRGRGQPRGGGHHGAGPDALRPADRVLARRRGPAHHRPAQPARPATTSPPPHCRRPGIRAACARRGRSGPGCPPSWTPSPTARCTGRPRTPRCGRRLRPGWPWRFAWCSGRPISWNGRKRRPAGPDAAERSRTACPARPGRLQPPDHAAAPRGIGIGVPAVVWVAVTSAALPCLLLRTPGAGPYLGASRVRNRS